MEFNGFILDPISKDGDFKWDYAVEENPALYIVDLASRYGRQIFAIYTTSLTTPIIYSATIPLDEMSNQVIGDLLEEEGLNSKNLIGIWVPSEVADKYAALGLSYPNTYLYNLGSQNGSLEEICFESWQFQGANS